MSRQTLSEKDEISEASFLEGYFFQGRGFVTLVFIVNLILKELLFLKPLRIDKVVNVDLGLRKQKKT